MKAALYKKQTNPLVQLNLMFFFSFYLLHLWLRVIIIVIIIIGASSEILLAAERNGVDTQIRPDQAVRVKINFMM